MRSLRRSPAALWTSFALLLLLSGCAGAGPVVAPAAPAAPPATTPAPTAIVLASAPAPAPAAAPAPPLVGDGPQSDSIAVEGTDYVRGRTAVKVHAPIARVREAVVDFAHYAEFMPHYRSAKLLGRTATGARDVYMEIEALNGLVIMWCEMEFPKPTIVSGVEITESKFIKGNVDDFKAVWRLRPIDDATTELSLEVFLQPSIPLPTSLINSENLKGSLSGVTAMRGRIEGAPAGH
jgi:ribosome-associated toxin RatA of RatAB toxin-antitoxin module